LALAGRDQLLQGCHVSKPILQALALSLALAGHEHSPAPAAVAQGVVLPFTFPNQTSEPNVPSLIAFAKPHTHTQRKKP